MNPNPEKVKELAKRRAAFNGKAEQAGLGDTIKRITEALGLKPCEGCERRRKRLNELFPYRRKR